MLEQWLGRHGDLRWWSLVRPKVSFINYVGKIDLVVYFKSGQNKKDQKFSSSTGFLNPFSQLPAVKKYSNNSAAGKFFGPSYFDPALFK